MGSLEGAQGVEQGGLAQFALSSWTCGDQLDGVRPPKSSLRRDGTQDNCRPQDAFCRQEPRWVGHMVQTLKKLSFDSLNNFPSHNSGPNMGGFLLVPPPKQVPSKKQ